MLNKSICLSHGKDVDGLASAAIIKMATNADIVLVDYGDLIESLKTVKSAETVYICDVGLNDTLGEQFIKELERIRKFAPVHYIDHHPLQTEAKKRIISLGVNLEHSTDESCSVLTYLKFRNNLKRGASILAAYGAVTDYMDDKPMAKKIISKYDRQFILLESTLLSYALAGATEDKGFKQKAIEDLSNLKYPHEIEGAINYSKAGLDKTAKLFIEVAEKGVKHSLMAHMESNEGSTGTIATILIGAFDVPVGVAYQHIRDEDIYEVSLREAFDADFDLAKIVTLVTRILGAGSGGGHKKACGARIPKPLLNDFLDLLEFELDKMSTPSGRTGEEQMRKGIYKPPIE